MAWQYMLFFSLRRSKIQHLREQLNTRLTARIRRMLVLLFMLAGAHTFAISWLEGMSLGDALWLTATTLTTVGYGDISASTAGGRLATVAFLYLAGIFVLAQLAGDFIDLRIQHRERKMRGQWDWKMKEHIVLVNAPANDTISYLHRLLIELRKVPSFADMPVVLISDQFENGLPDKLLKLGMVHVHGNAQDNHALADASAQHAAYILLLAQNAFMDSSDLLTFDLLDRFASNQYPATIACEFVRDENRERFKRLGATSVMRALRAHPEMLVRSLVTPGSEQLLENLFTQDGVHIVRIDISIADYSWKSICSKLLEVGIGTPLAYVSNDDQVISQPPFEEVVNAKGLLLLQDSACDVDKNCLEGIF